MSNLQKYAKYKILELNLICEALISKMNQKELAIILQLESATKTR